MVLVVILLGASTVVATRCVHRTDERLVKEHGKALLNHSRRRASLRSRYFEYHDTIHFSTRYHFVHISIFHSRHWPSRERTAKVEYASRDTQYTIRNDDFVAIDCQAPP